jgi:hypothetical protein
VALKEPEGAIPHLEKAISLNSDDEVAYYQLPLAYKALGDVVGQQNALGEFRRLREQGAQALNTQVPIKPPDVTKGVGLGSSLDPVGALRLAKVNIHSINGD